MSAQVSETVHVVRAGETLGGLARRFRTTVQAIALRNAIRNVNLIRVGQVLRIPRPLAVAGVAVVPAVPAGSGISLDALCRIMPTLPHASAQAYLPFLNAAMVEGAITTGLRQAAFLAQIAHESVELRFFEEIASGARYEGRKDLGNTQPGDGRRFKGRGPIQLTGRANYTAAGRALGLDLVGHPETVATPQVGFRVAQWFWTTHGLNALADQQRFDDITRRINGGLNGTKSRDAYYRMAKSVLGV